MSKKMVENTKNYRECYESIYCWHITYGKILNYAALEGTFSTLEGSTLEEKMDFLNQLDEKPLFNQNQDIKEPSLKAYLALLTQLPKPENAKPECMVFIFEQVILGLMEWAGVAKDKSGCHLSDYAKEGMRLLRVNSDKCHLHSVFGQGNWQKHYPYPTFICNVCGKNKVVGNIYHIKSNRLKQKHVCHACSKITRNYYWSRTSLSSN